ncbi:MAG: RNA polymerase sigma factor [Armatimonadetes bacterium]|nr:RNA polymerase sigma factor [Armatimonadota bacterium]
MGHVQPSRWAEQFARGDRRVGDRLADHVRSVLRRRFLALGLTSQDAEDLVQECVVLVFDAIHEFDAGKGNLDSWLSGYARNVARSWWRGAYSRRRSESSLDSVPEVQEEFKTDLAGSGALEAALGELNPIDQELLQMRFCYGYSFDEIAEMADITPVNARKRVSRAVECLRKNEELRHEIGFVG